MIALIRAVWIFLTRNGEPLKGLLNIWKPNWAVFLCKKEGGVCRVTPTNSPYYYSLPQPLEEHAGSV